MSTKGWTAQKTSDLEKVVREIKKTHPCPLTVYRAMCRLVLLESYLGISKHFAIYTFGGLLGLSREVCQYEYRRCETTFEGCRRAIVIGKGAKTSKMGQSRTYRFVVDDSNGKATIVIA